LPLTPPACSTWNNEEPSAPSILQSPSFHVEHLLQTGPNPAKHQNGTHPTAGAKRAPTRVSFPPHALFSAPQPPTNTLRSNLFHPNELLPNSPNASQPLSTTSPRFPQRKHKRADHGRFTLNCHG
jgi:hypothetical protein